MAASRRWERLFTFSNCRRSHGDDPLCREKGRSALDGSTRCWRRNQPVSSRLRWPTRRRGSPGRCSSGRKIIGFGACCCMSDRLDPPEDSKVQLGKGDYGVMQTGRDRGLNKPEALSEHQARRREWDQSADTSGPAAIGAAHKGRTYDCTRPSCTNAHKTPCQTGASTYDKAVHAARLKIRHSHEAGRPVTSGLRYRRFGATRARLGSEPQGSVQPQ